MLRKLDEIIVAARQRRDMGDIESLAASIAERSLLQPIAIRPDGTLVAGARRLAAASLLGWESIPCHVVDGCDEEIAALTAERDENTCRKDFTPSEAVAIGRAIEELERPKAKERQEATRAKAGEKVGAGHCPAPTNGHAKPNGRTRDLIGAAVGMSGKTYEKAKAVVKAAEAKPEIFGPVVEQMDRTGNVDGAYRKLGRPAPAKTEKPLSKHRFDDAFDPLLTLSNSVRYEGGIAAYTATWEPELRDHFVAMIDRYTATLAEWRNHLCGEN